MYQWPKPRHSQMEGHVGGYTCRMVTNVALLKFIYAYDRIGSLCWWKAVTYISTVYDLMNQNTWAVSEYLLPNSELFFHQEAM